MTVVYFLLMFTLVVLAHELGHYLFARLLKIGVADFAIGFGPALFRWKMKNGANFRINIFPLGGYVRMEGEDPTQIDQLPEEEKKHLLYARPAWQRFLVSFSGPLFSILFGYLLFALSAGVWGIPTVGIDRVDPFSPAFEAGIQNGDIIQRVDGKRVFSTDELSTAVKRQDEVQLTLLRGEQSLQTTVYPTMLPTQHYLFLKSDQPLPQMAGQSVALVNGKDPTQLTPDEMLNKQLSFQMEDGRESTATLEAFQTYDPRRAIGIAYANLSTTVRSATSPLQDGDTILAINGTPVQRGSDFYAIVSLLQLPAQKGMVYTFVEIRQNVVTDQVTLPSQTLATVTVRRNGSEITLQAPVSALLQSISEAYFQPANPNWYPSGPLRAFGLGVVFANRTLARMGQILGQLFTGGTTVKDFAGPIGLVKMVGIASRGGLETMVFLMAFFTLNLGLFNLLPLPALDGGRIVFNLVEMVSRKKINPVVEGYIHTIGFFLLLALLFYISYFDVIRFLK